MKRPEYAFLGEMFARAPELGLTEKELAHMSEQFMKENKSFVKKASADQFKERYLPYMEEHIPALIQSKKVDAFFQAESDRHDAMNAADPRFEALENALRSGEDVTALLDEIAREADAQGLVSHEEPPFPDDPCLRDVLSDTDVYILDLLMQRGYNAFSEELQLLYQKEAFARFQKVYAAKGLTKENARLDDLDDFRLSDFFLNWIGDYELDLTNAENPKALLDLANTMLDMFPVTEDLMGIFLCDRCDAIGQLEGEEKRLDAYDEAMRLLPHDSNLWLRFVLALPPEDAEQAVRKELDEAEAAGIDTNYLSDALDHLAMHHHIFI